MRPNSDAHSTGAERVAGLTQSLRLIRQGKARRVYLAGDADRAAELTTEHTIHAKESMMGRW